MTERSVVRQERCEEVLRAQPWTWGRLANQREALPREVGVYNLPLSRFREGAQLLREIVLVPEVPSDVSLDLLAGEGARYTGEEDDLLR